MAKAKAAPKPPGGPRGGGAAPPKPERGGNYFKEVYQELRKVSWPTRAELLKMTQVVIATVILFAAIIGAADLIMSVAVKQLYVQSGSTTIKSLQGK